MKAQLILARATSGCAALFVNKAVVMHASATAEADKLVDVAHNFSAALGVPLVECTFEDSANNPAYWNKELWSDLASTLPTVPDHADVVPVRIYNAYEDEECARLNTYSLEVIDRRECCGSARLIVAATEGGQDASLLDVLLEVQASPFDATKHIPAAHLHVDMDDPVATILKLGDKLLVRPNSGVRLESDVIEIEGQRESVFWIVE